MELADTIAAARGDHSVDLLLRNGRLLNVMSGEIHPASVAVHRGLVVGFGDYDAAEVVDLDGRYITPGLIDGHLHLESSMLSIPEFARHVLPHGTTSVVADPHEIANVMGAAGVRYMLESSEGLPLRVFLMFPSCVPATPFETSGATLTDEDMKPFLNEPRVLGLAEMMNFPGLVSGEPEILAKLNVFRDRVLDGHAPGLSGKGLCAYAAAGIGSDHECTDADEAREKLRLGMRIMIREGSAAKNLDALFPVVTEFNSRRCFFVTDDLDPQDIDKKGHVGGVVRKALAKGMDPVRAFQMASINTAEYFGLKKLGAIAPGYWADMLVLNDLDDATIAQVYHAGRLVAREGRTIVPCEAPGGVERSGSVRVDREKASDLSVPAKAARVNIIEVVPHQITTRRIVEDAPVKDGLIVSDTDRDLLKIAVIERHNGTGSQSVGLIKGFGLKRGAIGSTVAHDSHNILVVGVSDEDMIAAARVLETMGGGLVVIENGAVTADLPLTIAGLMSPEPLESVCEKLDGVIKAAHSLGCALDEPFATLSFMALTPIPELKITDRGLFDSVNFQFVDLFAD